MSDAYLGSRLNYDRGTLDQAPDDPVEFLKRWLAEAAAESVMEPTAMCLSTVDLDGRPSSRMVLMRGLDARGLVFYTNYLSRKGRELAANPHGAVCFWWCALERQVRVEGKIEKVSPEESDIYFYGRPASSRRASAASPQSEPVDSAEALQALLDSTPEEPERPDHWGGYRLIPTAFEFWQGRPARLHDRFRCVRIEHEWVSQRLAP